MYAFFKWQSGRGIGVETRSESVLIKGINAGHELIHFLSNFCHLFINGDILDASVDRADCSSRGGRKSNGKRVVCHGEPKVSLRFYRRACRPSTDVNKINELYVFSKFELQKKCCTILYVVPKRTFATIYVLNN